MDKEQDIFYKLTEKAKKVSLSEREKTAIFSAVDSFVAKNPLTSPLAIPKAPVRTWAIFNFPGAYAFASALLVVILGTTTSFAAQGALPGDFLYPIKVSFNEEIKSAFLFGSSQIEYDVKRAESRLNETKELALADRLTDESRTSIARNLDVHVSNVKKGLEELTDAGDFEKALAISTKLEVALAGDNVVSTSLDHAEIPKDQLAFVNDIVKDSQMLSASAKEDTEDAILTQKNNSDISLTVTQAKSESIKKTLNSIEQKLALNNKNNVQPTGASALTMSLKTTANAKLGSTTSASNLSQTLLDQARALVDEGEEKLQNQEYSEAIRLFRKAEQISQLIEIKDDIENTEIRNEIDSVILELDPTTFGIE